MEKKQETGKPSIKKMVIDLRSKGSSVSPGSSPSGPVPSPPGSMPSGSMPSSPVPSGSTQGPLSSQETDPPSEKFVNLGELSPQEAIALLNRFGWKGSSEDLQKVLGQLPHKPPSATPMGPVSHSSPSEVPVSNPPTVVRTIPAIFSSRVQAEAPRGSTQPQASSQPPHVPQTETPKTGSLPGPIPSRSETISDPGSLPSSVFGEQKTLPGQETRDHTGITLPPIEICPRCGWDLKIPYKVEVSDDDRLRFQTALLSGTRFTKAYLFFDGAMRVVFRSLSSREAELSYACTMADAAKDLADKAYRSALEYWGNLISYRLALSLQEFYTERLGAVCLEEFDKLEFSGLSESPSDFDKLRALHEYVFNHVLKLESIKRMVGTLFQEFQRVYEQLEQDFLWKKKTT